jgi:hypothetical protein
MRALLRLADKPTKWIRKHYGVYRGHSLCSVSDFEAKLVFQTSPLFQVCSCILDFKPLGRSLAAKL